MRFYYTMTRPASPKKATACKLLPVIGGFVLFSALAAFNQLFALAAAIGVIGFAAVSMLVAITRKE